MKYFRQLLKKPDRRLRSILTDTEISVMEMNSVLMVTDKIVEESLQDSFI